MNNLKTTMNIHVYTGIFMSLGGTSSSSCSNYTLQRKAIDLEPKYGKEVANTLRRDFYVDNFLKSV